MVFVQLPPLSKRCFALLLACIGLTSTCCFAQPKFFLVDTTPYDRQMLRVQPVLTTDTNRTERVSLTLVNQWMTALRQIPYRYSKQWQTPREVRITRSADCKGKAMALYEIMRKLGATDVRFVIGRHNAGDWFTHAWLQWETATGKYVLDPTFSRGAVKVDHANPSRYIPLYAYEGAFRYRALNVSPIPEVPLRAVAAGNRNWTRTSFPGLE